MQVISWAIRIVIFLVILLFALKNSDTVTVDLIAGRYIVPLVVLVLSSFGLGCLVGVLALSGRLFHQYREISKLKRDLKKNSEALAKANQVNGLVNKNNDSAIDASSNPIKNDTNKPSLSFTEKDPHVEKGIF